MLCKYIQNYAGNYVEPWCKPFVMGKSPVSPLCVLILVTGLFISFYGS